jgi:hypothetical protein
MSVYALIIGIILVAQVGTEDDRYAVPSDNSAAPTGSSATAPGGPETSDRAAGQPAADGAAVANPFSKPPAGSPPTGSFQAPGSSQTGATASSTEGTPPADSAASGNQQEPPQQVDRVPGSKQNTPTDASALMRSILTAPRESRLAGQPIGLADVVAGASSRAEQTALVEAYWDLCSSVADYYLGLEEQADLRRLRSLAGRAAPTWQRAESALAARVDTAQRAAAASQHRLASLMGRAQTDPLPLPGDMPHCGDYRTRYEQIFASRPSSEAAELNELLPLRYKELKDAAGSVARAEQWLDAVAAQPGGSDALRTLELLSLRRRAFVQIVCDYNLRIVRYAELAAPAPIAPDVLVGMLIKTDRPRVAGVERQRSTSEAGGSPPSTPATPPRSTGETAPTTRGTDWTPAGSSQSRHDGVTPTSAEIESVPQERSLLVPPRRR